MKLAAIALFLILCLTSLPVNADEPRFQVVPFDQTPVETQKREFERVVDLCIKAVREEVQYSRFDAFVQGNNARMFGTVEEKFKFEKCMSRNGQPLVPNREPDN
jgi:hypothetical protein